MKTKVFMLAVVMGVMFTILLSQAWALKAPGNLVGNTRQQAISALQKAGFAVAFNQQPKLTDKKNLDSRVAVVTYNSNPGANYEYMKGTTAYLMFYKYQVPRVPKVITLMESHAVGTLKGANYQVRVLKDGPIAPHIEMGGRVAKQEPPGDTIAPWGTMVTIHLYRRVPGR